MSMALSASTATANVMLASCAKIGLCQDRSVPGSPERLAGTAWRFKPDPAGAVRVSHTFLGVIPVGSRALPQDGLRASAGRLPARWPPSGTPPRAGPSGAPAWQAYRRVALTGPAPRGHVGRDRTPGTVPLGPAAGDWLSGRWAYQQPPASPTPMTSPN